tara:strand:+ start:1255 stop:2031 length:777 start_codon:yes stop_codon:yes gene_type:complete
MRNFNSYLRSTTSPLNPITLDETQIPETLTDAYELVRKEILIDSGFVACWKLGGTNYVTQDKFNTNQLYFGPMHSKEIFINPREAPKYKMFELKGELEIAFRISDKAINFNEKKSLKGIKLSELFDYWCIAYELPSSPILNLDQLGLKALILDRCASGAIVLSPMMTYYENMDWGNVKLTLKVNHKKIANANIDSLIKRPDEIAREFIELSTGLGFKLKEKQWISTGGLTECMNLMENDLVSIFFDENKVIEFIVKTN